MERSRLCSRRAPVAFDAVHVYLSPFSGFGAGKVISKVGE